MILSKKGELAIEPVYASKIEVEATTGFARASARSKVILARLVFSYDLNGKILEGGKAIAILPGESALQAWAKKEYETDIAGVSSRTFVLCPESIVIGFME